MPRVTPSDFEKKELVALVNAIIKKGGHTRTKTRALYQEIADTYILNGRSATAMQKAFYEQLAPNIYQFCEKQDADKFHDHFYPSKQSKSKQQINLAIDSGDSSSDDSPPVTVPSKTTPKKANRMDVLSTSSTESLPFNDRTGGASCISVVSLSGLLSGKVKNSKEGNKIIDLSSMDSSQQDNEFTYPRSPQSKSILTSKNMQPTVILNRQSVEKIKYKPRIEDNMQSVPADEISILSDEEGAPQRYPASSMFSLGRVLTGKQKVDKIGNDLVIEDQSNTKTWDVFNSKTSKTKKTQNAPSISAMSVASSVVSVGKVLSGAHKITETSKPLFQKKKADMVDEENHASTKNGNSKTSISIFRNRKRLNSSSTDYDTDEEPQILMEEKSPRKVERLASPYKIKTKETNKSKEQENIDSQGSQLLNLSGILAGSTAIVQDAGMVKKSMNKRRKMVKTVTFEKNQDDEKARLKEASEMIDPVDAEPMATSPTKSNLSVREENENDHGDQSEEVAAPSTTQVVTKQKLEPLTLNNMIAVGKDIRGKKCYFRLVPMTEEEVSEVKGMCVPYMLQAPWLQQHPDPDL